MTTSHSSSCPGSGLASRLPFLGCACSCLFGRNRAPGAPWGETLPFLAALTFGLLALSGLVLAAYYNPRDAWGSLLFVGHEVNNGWLVRTYHQTGTTALFGLVYVALFRGMLTRGYRAPKDKVGGEAVWTASVAALAVLLAAGWMGFVLTGSAAGASALNAAAAQPGAVPGWVFGGPAGPDSLARLLVVHLVLAVVLVGLGWLVFAALHAVRPKPAEGQGVAFFPTYASQYAAALAFFGFIFAVLAFFLPHLGVPLLARVPADPSGLDLGTALPWYLAAWGGIGSVAHGLWGVCAALVLLGALPWLDRGGGGWLYTLLQWVFALAFVALTLCPVPLVATLGTVWVFVHVLVLTPLVTALEAP